MDTKTLALNNLSIGKVFTPEKWAKWLILKWKVFDSWLNGASVCDPTAGQGVFALALFALARERDITISEEMLHRISLVEINKQDLDIFKEKARQDYGVNFPDSSLFAGDVIVDSHKFKYDILVGNPPWVNFNDLPAQYKEKIKPFFIKEGLVVDKRNLLLGSSRIDISALVLKVVLGRCLNRNGKGYFFVPTSLFLGDDAHRGFRDYKANNRFYNFKTVFEFEETKVFDKVGTSYCCVEIEIDSHQNFPVDYRRECFGGWERFNAKPLSDKDDPWIIFSDSEKESVKKDCVVKISAEQKPRQGVNTCGANSIYIFDEIPDFIPEEFIYPLVTRNIWKNNNYIPEKWIFIPYDKETAKPITWNAIEKYAKLKLYLEEMSEFLKLRKGVLVQSSIRKGFWWAMLGVGHYSFSPYKIIWEAYGKKEFVPKIVKPVQGKAWQGNQAMHAFIPSWSKSDAERIYRELLDPKIAFLLKKLSGEGKCNWAQPGKMKKLLSANGPTSRQKSFMGFVK